MAQATTHSITVRTIIGSVAFRTGVADFLEGRPCDVDKYRRNDQWRYERGRMYAAAATGRGMPVRPNRVGRHVNRAAERDYVELMRDGDIL